MRVSAALAGRPLWTFAVTRYGLPGAKPAALALQEAGLDVPLAFWLCWAASEGRDPRARLDEAMAVSAQWNRAIVHPLRGARGILKHPPGFVDAQLALSLRQHILDAELDAEAALLAALEAMPLPPLEGVVEAPSAALAMLETYREKAGVTAPLTAFTQAIFSEPKKE
ncbi:MAG: TIGR02444 family protein [Glycocaulis sp.]